MLQMNREMGGSLKSVAVGEVSRLFLLADAPTLLVSKRCGVLF